MPHTRSSFPSHPSVQSWTLLAQCFDRRNSTTDSPGLRRLSLTALAQHSRDHGVQVGGDWPKEDCLCHLASLPPLAKRLWPRLASAQQTWAFERHRLTLRMEREVCGAPVLALKFCQCALHCTVLRCPLRLSVCVCVCMRVWCWQDCKKEPNCKAGGKVLGSLLVSCLLTVRGVAKRICYVKCCAR